MAKFEAGNNPADHNVAEVVEYLKGDDVTGDEYDRVLQAEREREGGGRVGILNLSGSETAAPEPDSPPADAEVTEPAGPNEAATGEFSPADHAKDVDDPQASGDAGVTADQYPDEAPAALGPDMPQSQAEAEAHGATLAAHAFATQTPAEALKLATELAQQWRRPAADADNQ